MNRALVRPAIALAAPALGYAGLVAWLTWPLPAQMVTVRPRTHPACAFDYLHMAWALAYETRTLCSSPATFGDANIYFPAQHALFYGDGGFGALPYFIPTFLVSGNAALAINVTFLGCTVLTALALHLVVYTWTRSHVGGSVGALTYLMTRWTLWEFVPSAPQYAVMQYIPFIIFLLAVPGSTLRKELLLVALVVLQSLASLLYVGAALIAPLTLLAAVRLVRPSTRAAGIRLFAVIGLALLLLSPFVAQYIGIRVSNPHLDQQTYWSWWHPVTDLPWGMFWGYGSSLAVPFVSAGIVVVGTLCLAMRSPALELRRAWVHSAFWVAIGILMSVSPTISWYGRPISLPPTFLAAWLSIHRFIRVPNRLGVVGLIGLSLLTGLAFAECTNAIRRLPFRLLARIGPACLAFLFVVGAYTDYCMAHPQFDREALPRRYPTAPSIHSDSPIIRALRDAGGPLLELPVGLTRLGALPGPNASAEYRSTFHWRSLLNGYTGYWPAGFIERMQLATRLPEQDALRALRRATGLDMVLVHVRDLDPTQASTWLALADHGRDDLTLVARDDSDLLFNVREGAVAAGSGSHGGE